MIPKLSVILLLSLLILSQAYSLFTKSSHNQLKTNSYIFPSDSLSLSKYKTYNIRQMNTVITAAATDKSVTTTNPSLWSKVLAGWGVLGVVGIIGNALRRVIPIALQPFKQNDLTPIQLATYVVWGAYMLYVEGYKAFQLKFSPLVVRRAFTLADNPGVFNWLLAGPYSMGLFGATKKRLIVSWSISIGVFGIVSVVKRLGYPWRSIIDGGVVLGLSYGTASICVQFIQALFGKLPDIDPCLPEKSKKA